MMKVLDMMKTFYIKKVLFPGENQCIVELISLTEENVEIVNGTQVVKPEILSSCIREVSAENAHKEGLSDLENNEFKTIISLEQAKSLKNLVTDTEAFRKSVNSLFYSCK